jgi:tetratricopeptide (TPR) repeat protein
MNIEEYYQKICGGPATWQAGAWPFKSGSLPTDIYEHLPTLKRLGESVETVTEFGVRDAYSTVAWVMAKPKKLTCYDYTQVSDEKLAFFEQNSRLNGTDFTFHKASTLDIEIEPTELLFIDTDHTYKQLSAELKLHANKAQKYMVFHDTSTFGVYGTDKKTPGLLQAINELLLDQPAWEVLAEHKNCNGLTILANKFTTPLVNNVGLEPCQQKQHMLDEVVRTNPNSVAAHNRLGIFWYGRKNEKALECFSTAFAIEPENSETAMNIYRLYKSLGMADEAAKFLKKYESARTAGAMPMN